MLYQSTISVRDGSKYFPGSGICLTGDLEVCRFCQVTSDSVSTNESDGEGLFDEAEDHEENISTVRDGGVPDLSDCLWANGCSRSE